MAQSRKVGMGVAKEIDGKRTPMQLLPTPPARCPPDAEAGGPARPCCQSTQEGAGAARRRERRERIRNVHYWQCSLSLRGAGRARPKVRSLRFGGLARFGLVGVAYPLRPPAACHARANAHACTPQFLRAGTIELRSAGRSQS